MINRVCFDLKEVRRCCSWELVSNVGSFITSGDCARRAVQLIGHNLQESSVCLIKRQFCFMFNIWNLCFSLWHNQSDEKRCKPVGIVCLVT